MNRNVMPQGAVASAAVLAILGFAALLAVDAWAGADLPAMAALPVAFVVALWLVPVAGAALRGERWVFIGLLALLLFMTEAVFRSRAWNDKSVDWQVALKGGVWLAAGGVGLLHLGAVRRALARPPALFGGLLVALLAVSAAWSPDWTLTLNSALAYVCFLLFALAATQILDPDDILLGLAIGLSALVLPSVLVAPFGNSLAGFSPGSTASLDRLAGITDHPIGLAADSALALLICGLALARGVGWRWLWRLVIVCAIATLLLSRSRTPPMALLLAWGLAYSHHRGVLAQVLLAALAAAMAVGLVVFGVGLDELMPRDLLSLVSRSGAAQEVLTLTGRVEIWHLVLQKIAQTPWLGQGFGAGNMLLHDFRRWHLNHAHNAYLQVLLYTGAAGLALMMAAIWGQLRAFLRAPMPLRDTFTFFMLLMGVTEAVPLTNVPGSATLLWMLAIGLCVPRERPLAVAPFMPGDSAAETSQA